MRSAVSTLLAVSLLALVSCKKPVEPGPGPSPAPAEGDFRGSLPAADVQGFSYSKVENDQQSAESLTNPAVVSLTPFPKETTNVVVGFKRVRDKAANTSRTYKTEVRRAGKEVTLVVTDIANNEVVVNTRFPDPLPHPEVQQFDSLQACINDFLCKNGSALQCEANRTCQPQFWGLICCIKGQQFCVSVHGVVRPNTLRCQIIGPIVDFEATVFSQ